MKILIIEDEKLLADSLKALLNSVTSETFNPRGSKRTTDFAFENLSLISETT